MENIQINGQRRWGPPNDWSGPPPPHGTEVFVKNLPGDVFEEQLYRIFSMVGKVYEVRLPVHWSGDNRGYAFVRFTEVKEADAAIKAFDKIELRRGWRLEVQRSLDNTRLFLSSVPKDKNGDQLKKDLSEYVDNIKKVYAYPTEEKNVFRGYAFVEFETHRDAAIAKRILTPDVCSSLFEKKCIAAWANPQPFIDVSLLETLNMLFMRNIPKELKLLELKKMLKQILEDDAPLRIKRLNNFGFLTFQNHECAERALNKLKDNPRLTSAYEIQVEWAVPRELALVVPDRKKQFFSAHGESESVGREKKSSHLQFKNKSSRPSLSDSYNFVPSSFTGGNDQALGYGPVFATNGNFQDLDSTQSYEVRSFDRLRYFGVRDSSLSPTAVNSSGSSGASDSPPAGMFLRENNLFPDINLLLKNFTPFGACAQGNFIPAGTGMLIPPNPGNLKH